MNELIRRILDELANDPQLHITNVNIEELKVGSLFRKRSVLHIFGSVLSDEEKQTVSRTAHSAAGAEVEIRNDLTVKHKQSSATA
ncbi:MAG TPA: hypothetical protein VMW73_12775 [Spirochaetia bacterium]|nr:hypothetical protein [Spirochaetia bacterium]